jgi:hypothetical protein
LSTQSRDVVHPSERSDAGCLHDYLTGQHQSRKMNGGENNIISFLLKKAGNLVKL